MHAATKGKVTPKKYALLPFPVGSYAYVKPRNVVTELPAQEGSMETLYPFGTSP